MEQQAQSLDKALVAMATIRFLFGVANLTAVFLMLKSKSVATALKLNGILGSIGPFILLGVSAIGLIALAGKISPVKIAMIVAGVGLILYGTSR